MRRDAYQLPPPPPPPPPPEKPPPEKPLPPEPPGVDAMMPVMLEEGVVGIIERHQRIADLTRNGVKSLGLELLAVEERASNTVTAVRVPEGVEWKTLYHMLQDDYETLIEGGQGPLAGKIFRIGHLGWVSDEDIEITIDALRQALPRVGHEVPAATPAS